MLASTHSFIHSFNYYFVTKLEVYYGKDREDSSFGKEV